MLEKLSKYWKILEELTVMHLLIQTLFSSNDKTNKTRGSRPRITILSKITPAPDCWLHLGNIQFVAGWCGGGSDGWWWQLAVNYSEARRSAAGAYLLPALRLSMAGAVMTVCNIAIFWIFPCALSLWCRWIINFATEEDRPCVAGCRLTKCAI